MADELLPCPFCGGDPVMSQIEDASSPDNGAWFIQCTEAMCGASTNLTFALMDDCKSLVAEKWNRRPTEGPATVSSSNDEAERCAECGHEGGCDSECAARHADIDFVSVPRSLFILVSPGSKKRICFLCGESWHEDFEEQHEKKCALVTRPTPATVSVEGLVELRDWCQERADDCMKGKRPTIARRHYAQAFLTVVEKIALLSAPTE